MAKIRVLIADDNDETRDGTRRLLEYEDDITIVEFAENGQDAIDKVRELKPDVVLMDINMPVMDGITATQRIKGELPRTQIIVVSVQDDGHYVVEAMRAGAADFVAKPISSDDLSAAIRRVFNNRPAEATAAAAPAGAAQTPSIPGRDTLVPEKNGKVIAVLGPKGGVGKTTVAVNLAVGLNQSVPGSEVIAVDGNIYFGDVGVFLNTRGQYNITDLAALADTPEEFDRQQIDTIVLSHESGVKLLVAPPNPGSAAQIGVQRLSSMLSFLKKNFDYVVVDTATTFDDVLVAVLQTADLVVLLAEPTMPALKDARIMLGELAGVEFDSQRVLLVVNKVGRNVRITPEQITNFLRLPVSVQIPADPTADEALNRGLPLVLLDAHRAPSVRPLTEVVRLVHERVSATPQIKEIEPEPESRGRGGLFGVLRGN